MPFKPQIKLLVASKELQTSATIPNPSEEDRAAFVWLAFTPEDLKTAVETYKAAVREMLSSRSKSHSRRCLELRASWGHPGSGEEDCPDPNCPSAK